MIKKRIAVAVFSLIFTLVATEFLFSHFLPQKTYSSVYKNAISCFDKSETTVFRLKPNCSFPLTNYETKEVFTTRTNFLGYRGEDFDIKKPVGEKRIMISGDSFILGFGVKDGEVITSILEEKLRKISPANLLKGAKVINAGYAGGFGPDGYYLHLKNTGIKLEPDLVIFSIFVFNDFSDMKNNEWIGAGKYGQPQKVISKTIFVDEKGNLLPIGIPLVYRLPIVREIHLAIFTENAVSKIKERINHYVDRIQFKINPPVMPTGDARDSNLPAAYERSCIFGEVCHRQNLHLYSDLLSTILASRELVESQFTDGKLHFVVLIIPADFQIYPDVLAKYQDTTGIPLNAAEIENPNPQKKIKELLAWEKIPYIDLLPVFRENKNRLYFIEDGHWNTKGHAAAAEEIEKWIKKNY